MEPSKIRKELLAQHADIRTKMDLVRSALDLRQKGQGSDRELLDCLQQLKESVAVHNARENELLRDFIRDVDMWGPLRVEGMHDAHEKEHSAINEALDEAMKKVSGEGLSQLLSRMTEHMELEEKDVLAKDLFDDNGPPIDSFGG